MDGHAGFVDLYSERELSVDVPNKRGETPLFTAIQHGKLQSSKALLQAHASVALSTNNLSTPLHLAVELSDCLSVCLLLKYGAATIIYLMDKHGDTALSLAVKSGSVPIVTILLRANSHGVNQLQGRTGESPLYLAASAGDNTLVTLLLAHGALVNLPAKNGITPLMTAVQHSHTSIVKQLIGSGANVIKTQMVQTLLNHPLLNSATPAILSPLVALGLNAPPRTHSLQQEINQNGSLNKAT